MVALEIPTPTGLGDAVGIGVDMAEVAEFEARPFAGDAAFYRRFFSPDEIAYCRSQAVPAQHFAARFAAKEAAVKAFSSVAELGYWQIEVVRGVDGAPTLRLWNEARTAPPAELTAYRPLVSLSHTDSLATAFVVVYKRGD